MNTREGPSSADDLSALRVAIVHDWLPVYAGAERVLEQMLQVFPQADVFALFDFLPESQRAFLGGRQVQTSFFQRLPGARSRYRNYIALAPLAIEQFDLSGYDLVVSSSYVVAKAVLTSASQIHVSYVHTPLRYAWDQHFDYLRDLGITRGPKSWVFRTVMHYLRLYDAATSNRVDHFLANSRFVAGRIRKYYRRDAEVLYPPVDLERFTVDVKKDDYYVTTSRLVSHKKVHVVAEAFARMPSRRLVIIGEGPMRQRIEKLGAANIQLMGHAPDEEVPRMIAGARAFVFAAEEDFGIVPVEAQAAGTPVIAFGSGGALETVVDGETGIFFDAQTPEAIVEAVERFEDLGPVWSSENFKKNVIRFSIDEFRRGLSEACRRAMKHDR